MAYKSFEEIEINYSQVRGEMGAGMTKQETSDFLRMYQSCSIE